MRAVVGKGGLDRGAASSSQMGLFETGWLTSAAILAALADVSGGWIDSAYGRSIYFQMDQLPLPPALCRQVLTAIDVRRILRVLGRC